MPKTCMGLQWNNPATGKFDLILWLSVEKFIVQCILTSYKPSLYFKLRSLVAVLRLLLGQGTRLLSTYFVSVILERLW